MAHLPVEPPSSFKFAWTKYSDAEIRDFELCLRSFAVVDYHRDRSYYRSPGIVFHVVYGGRGIVEMRGSKFPCGPNSMFVFWTDDEAVFYDVPGKETWNYVWFWLAGREAQKIAAMAGLSPFRTYYDLSQCPKFIQEVQRCRETFEGRNFSPLYPVASAWNLMDALSLELRGSMRPAASTPPANEMRILIENLPMDEISINGLAKHFGVTRATITRWFHNSFGVAPKEYINNIRFERAASLLEKSSLSVKEVAMLCGFNNPGYFSTAFRRRFGRPPRRRPAK